MTQDFVWDRFIGKQGAKKSRATFPRKDILHAIQYVNTLHTVYTKQKSELPTY